jgi:ATP-dependent DNA helicase RecG
LITGRTPAEEKDAVMEEFQTGAIHVLVSTTVIEVGLDVPNASVLLVHDAGRFGLAQLHQLRGRVGRGSHLSHCILLLQKNDAEAAGKLRVLETTSDGFVIAEEDLLFRGPGDALGTAQSGLPGLSAPGRALLGDVRLLAGARALAEKLLDQDPGLSEPSHQHLRHCLDSAENLPRSG